GTGSISFGGGPGTFNDGGPATQALLQLPSGVAVDKSGNVFIADTGDNIIREVTPDGVIQTVAGDSYAAYFNRDTSEALFAEFNKPGDVAVDSSGAVWIADTTNNAVRKYSGGAVITIVGDTSASFKGDGGTADKAGLIAPTALAFDGSGNLYI